MSEILERIFFSALYEYLHPLFSPSLFCLRKGRSFIIQIVIYLENLYNANEPREDINVSYTDYEKPIDKVDHGLLLQKLLKIGVRGRILKVIQT